MAHFSDFYDRSPEAAGRRAFSEHLENCSRCRRYEEVVRGGVDLLRGLTDAEISEDFHLRLQHRIFHIEDEQSLVRGGTSASGTTTVTAVAMALLLVIAAWSPTLLVGDPEIQLPAIVISEPSPRPVPAPPSTLLLRQNSSLEERALWNHTHSLLYEYSPLSDRSRGSLVRTGLD